MQAIRIYDNSLKFLGIIDNYQSLIWTRKYFETGSFELHLPITSLALNLLQKGNIVAKRNSVEAGVIEDISLKESKNTSEAVIKGRFLSSYFDRRITKGTYVFSGKAEEGMRELVSNAEPFPLVELGALNGFTETIEFQATYKNVLTYLSKIAKATNIAYRLVPDFTNKKILFETYKGLDRTSSQSENSKVIFSENFDNLDTVTYKYNDQSEKTVLYSKATYSSGDTKKEIVVVVGDTDSTGLDLREVYSQGQVEITEGMTEAEFTTALTNYATTKLLNYSVSESLESDINPTGNFTYKTHYDLGDIVTVYKKSWGLKLDLRITEMQEIYEHDIMTVTPTLGSALPDTVDWSDN